MKELWLSWQLILEEDCLASCLLCIQSEFMANITKASINTFCMLTLWPRPSMQAALPNLPQQLWEFWVATRYKFRPPTVSREPHMRCRPARRSNCTPQLTGKSRLQSLRKAPRKLNVAGLVSALVSPQYEMGGNFLPKDLYQIYVYIYHIDIVYICIPQNLFLIYLITFGMFQEYQGLGRWNSSETTPGLRRFATEDSFTEETVRPQAVIRIPKTI